MERIVRSFHDETTPEQRANMVDHDWLYGDLGPPR